MVPVLYYNLLVTVVYDLLFGFPRRIMKINEKNCEIREEMKKQGSLKKVSTLAALKKRKLFYIFQGFQSC